MVFSSSVQALLDNPYGRSKRAVEERVSAYAASDPGTGVIFRLPNFLANGAGRSTTSAVATFCHRIARDLPIQISDENNLRELAYIDIGPGDLITLFWASEVFDHSTPDTHPLDVASPAMSATVRR